MESWIDAVDILSRANKMFPNDYELLKALARSLMKLKRTDELEKVYLRMRDLNPNDHSLLLYLGQIAFNSGRKEEGLDYYDKAIRMDPGSPMAWKVLAEALDSLGKLEEARRARNEYRRRMDRLKKKQRIVGPI